MTTNQSQPELLPCPWCGKTDKLEVAEVLGETVDGKPYIAAGCERCDVCGPSAEYNGGKVIPIPHPHELIVRSAQAWNTRHPLGRAGDGELPQTTRESLINAVDTRQTGPIKTQSFTAEQNTLVDGKLVKAGETIQLLPRAVPQEQMAREIVWTIGHCKEDEEVLVKKVSEILQAQLAARASEGAAYWEVFKNEVEDFLVKHSVCQGVNGWRALSHFIPLVEAMKRLESALAAHQAAQQGGA